MCYAYLAVTATFVGAAVGALLAHLVLVPASVALGFCVNTRSAREAICTAAIVAGIVGFQVMLVLGSALRAPADHVPRCRHCGYNLTLNATGTCPECGTSCAFACGKDVDRPASEPVVLPQPAMTAECDPGERLVLAHLTERFLDEPASTANGRPVVAPKTRYN